MPQDIPEPKIQQFDKKDMPSPEQQKNLENAVKKLLNPDGSNPQMDGYVTNTFSYILNMLTKMAETDNKEQAAQEIAEDLKAKFEGWANQQKAKKNPGETQGQIQEGQVQDPEKKSDI